MATRTAADKGEGRARPASRRIKTLTQAALNADATVVQVEALLGGAPPPPPAAAMPQAEIDALRGG